MPSSRSSRAFAIVRGSTESVTSNSSPRGMPERRSRSAPIASARSARLPATGMMSGRSAGNRLAMVFMSLVCGETTKASPA